MSKQYIKNGLVYIDHRFAEKTLCMEGGKLTVLEPSCDTGDGRVLDAKGLRIVPGFIDTHTHGGVGVDVNGATAEDYEKICRFMAENGTTGWLCSILTDTQEQTEWCIGEVKRHDTLEQKGAELLGIHLEGPFLAPEYKGAMPERLLHQHEPAVFGAVLESDCYCEVIADGRHLHPGTVRILVKAKGGDKIVAISDSIMAAGLPDGEYHLGVNEVVVENGDAKLKSNGVRAGSTLTQDVALKNLVAFTGLSLEEVLPFLSENPAKEMGFFNRKGSIETGKDADLVLLDDTLSVVHVFARRNQVK